MSLHARGRAILGGKTKKVKLGRKGSFVIKHPGALRRKAKAAGESTAEFAKKHESDKGVTGRQARSAEGLMAMHKG